MLLYGHEASDHHVAAPSADEMSLYAACDGSNSRHYIYVGDVAAAFIKILHKGIIGETYNIGCETEYTNTTGAVFLIFTCIWFYTRNIVFPYIIYICWNYDVDMGNSIYAPYLIPFFCFMLFCLFIMHCYWMYLFIVMIYRFATEGSTDDIEEDKKIKYYTPSSPHPIMMRRSFLAPAAVRSCCRSATCAASSRA